MSHQQLVPHLAIPPQIASLPHLLPVEETHATASPEQMLGRLASFFQQYLRSPSPPSVVEVFYPKAFAGMAILPPSVDDRSIPMVLEAPKPHAGLARFLGSPVLRRSLRRVRKGKGGQRVGRKVTAVTTGNRNRQYSCGL
ncbi:MAG TPA: hypothetical protein VHA33_08030 [Candidatus Angelobacter sp.]|jgi:hypothetical protein|nr:hypothetical protein [Candidatus Angelobacter sp.]